MTLHHMQMPTHYPVQCLGSLACPRACSDCRGLICCLRSFCLCSFALHSCQQCHDFSHLRSAIVVLLHGVAAVCTEYVFQVEGPLNQAARNPFTWRCSCVCEGFAFGLFYTFVQCFLRCNRAADKDQTAVSCDVEVVGGLWRRESEVSPLQSWRSQSPW